MKLVNPTDDQLDAAVAEHVAGWVPYVAPQNKVIPPLPYTHFDDSAHIDDSGFPRVVVTQFTRSMDAVLPLMEKEVVKIEHHCGMWIATIHRGYKGTQNNPFAERIDYVGHSPQEAGGDKFLPRACCIALLRAHGIEVEFSK